MLFQKSNNNREEKERGHGTEVCGPKIFTVWYITGKSLSLLLRPSELLFELKEISSSRGGEFSVVKISAFRLF